MAIISGGSPDKAVSAPSTEDFSTAAVQRAVLKESATHPATLGAAGCALVALGAMLIFGLGPWTAGYFVFTSLAAVGSCAFHYFYHGQDYAKTYVEGLTERKEKARQQEVYDIQRSFSILAYAEGVNQITEFNKAYLKLRQFLGERMREGKNFDAEKFMAHTEDTYKQGVSIMKNATEICRAVKEVDISGAERERDKLSKEIKKMLSDDPSIELKEAKLDGIKRKIELYEQREKTLQQLLTETAKLTNAFDSAYLELVDLVRNDNDLSVAISVGSVSSLERAVLAARRAEERIRGNTIESEEADRIYLEASKKIKE